MREIRAAGVATLDGIASALNAQGVRAARGGAWHPNTVRNLLAREAPSAVLAKLATSRPSRYRTAMPVSDLTIDRCARRVIQLCRNHATARAREIEEEMRRRGDHDSANIWLRIIVAIDELGGPYFPKRRNP